MKKLFPLLLVLVSCAGAPRAIYRSCKDDPERLQIRSTEIKEIAKADQEDRNNFYSKNHLELLALSKQDLIRRKRIGEIFGEGCLSSAQDYAASALVYQHGDTSDHYFQAHIWARRAVELGDKTANGLMAASLDRYLISTGKKQLFGTQAHKEDMRGCWCLEQIEESFPDVTRKQITGRNLGDALMWVQELNKGFDCPTQMCQKNLKPTLQGTIPGTW